MRKAFTLIELIATIVILGVVTSIVSVLVMNIIRSSKENANRRNIDEYGRIIETSMAEYQSQYLKYPDSIDQLEIEYVGSVIECETRRINPDKTIYLSECKVNGKKVLDKSTEDGYYHYGTLVLTNEEYVDKLGKNIELALKDYYEENNKYPINYRLLNLPKLDKDVNCVSEIHKDGTVYLTKCSIDGSYILNENEEDGYYHYGKEIPTAVKYLLKKTNPITVTNYTDGDIHEMYTFEHEATEQTPALTDYRYIGSDPNNYVEFNNELWRIIGVFKVEDENGNLEERVKLIRNESLGNYSWDSSDSTVNNGAGLSEWDKSDIMNELNDDYLDLSLTSDTFWYNGSNNQKNGVFSYNNVLTRKSQSMFKEAKYYLGYISGGSGGDYYSIERNNKKYQSRSLSWIGMIGLIYPSDYVYTYAYGVDATCYSNPQNCFSNNLGWLYGSWTITYFIPYNNRVYNLFQTGRLYVGANGVSYTSMVKPTLYLKPNVKIISGDGTIDNVYKLSL